MSADTSADVPARIIFIYWCSRFTTYIALDAIVTMDGINTIDSTDSVDAIDEINNRGY